jgi:hypothetical protein
MSYFAKDPLRFRVLTIIAASCLVIYFLLQPELSITIVYWNVFFIMLNAFQLVRILIERHQGVDPVSLAVATIKKNLSKQKVSSQESRCPPEKPKLPKGREATLLEWREK